MSTSALESTGPQRGWSRPGGIALLTVSWSLAGGLAGGLLVVLLMSVGRLHPDPLPAILMAALGSVLGAVHGAVLARLGRPEVAQASDRRDRWLITLSFAVVACIAAVIGSGWLALSAATARAGSMVGWVMLATGGILSLGTFVWATVLGWRALEHAYARWPDHSLGSWLTVGVFLVLTGTFLVLRPAFPGTGLPVSPMGGLFLAAVATLWVALPAIIIALSFAHRRIGSS
jgi:hypothetical protein